MFKCPYCQQDSYSKTSKKKGQFESWKAVKGHTQKCSKSDKSYFIDSNIGPINIKEVYNLDYLKFRFKFSEAKTNIHNIKRSFIQRNINTGIHSKHITKEFIIDKIKEFYLKNNRIPNYRDFDTKNSSIDYISSTTIQTYFGTFNEAIKAAGFKPDYNDGFGIRTVAKDGILYRSQAEAYFVDNYLYGKYKYEYERKYDNYTKWYDFYLPELNLYIELDGGLRPQVIEEKILINKQENKNFIVIKTSDIYKNCLSLVVGHADRQPCCGCL